jgi:hypothetical protein
VDDLVSTVLSRLESVHWNRNYILMVLSILGWARSSEERACLPQKCKLFVAFIWVVKESWLYNFAWTIILLLYYCKLLL